MSHLKRIRSPKSWPIARKTNKFVIRPNAGKVQDLSLPLGFVLKEIVGMCDTLREVKVLLSKRQVSVDGKVRTDYKHPVGLYEVITAGESSYRITLGKNGKLSVIVIDQKEKDTRLLQITSKMFIKGGKQQLGFLGGRVLIVDDAKKYNVGDSIVLDANNKIVDHVSFTKGTLIQFIGGRHMGAKGVVSEIEGQKIIVTIDNVPTETLKKYAFAVGTKSEVITV